MADPADGNSLQEQMGMERCGDSFQAMLVAIRESCAARGINSNVAYRKQSPAKLKAVKDDVFKKLSFLIQFEGAWPVTSYLKMQLKCHLSHAVRVDARVGRQRSSSPPLRGAGPSGKVRERSKRGNSPGFKTGSNNAYVAIPGRAGMRSHSPSGCSDGGGRSREKADVACSPEHPMLKTLLTVGLPRDDAHRLAELFRQSGIRDEAYLRVFARMSTRDGSLGSGGVAANVLRMRVGECCRM
ncbi:hypothetical protein C8Q76DRAFT_687833 [Earliella scabrosa]|nr:hypothetical protein C8Q76DRAFT_687833 [Earliella scabrosa]